MKINAMSRIAIMVFLFSAMLAAVNIRAEVPANAVWIDVRTPGEYAQGHLPQAQLIPYDGIRAGITGLHLDRSTPIYLYCAVGARAEKARQSLLAQGYTNVTNAGSLEDARQLATESGD